MSNNDELERQRFEKWWVQQIPIEDKTFSLSHWRGEKGEYHLWPAMSSAWIGWQARSKQEASCPQK